jgi:glutathione S-transferase
LNELSKAWKDTVSELNIYNQWLEGNSFAAGNSFSVADCILFPIINFLDRNGMDWKGHGFKNLETYHKIVTETETYTKAYPQSWREAEKTSKVGELLDHLKKIN